MFWVQKQQIDELSAQMLADFAERLAAKLVQDHPVEAATMNDPDLRHLVEQGVREARKLDITSEVDITRYVETLFLRGKAYLSRPAVTSILTSSELMGDQKMDLLDEYELFSD